MQFKSLKPFFTLNKNYELENFEEINPLYGSTPLLFVSINNHSSGLNISREQFDFLINNSNLNSKIKFIDLPNQDKNVNKYYHNYNLFKCIFNLNQRLDISNNSIKKILDSTDWNDTSCKNSMNNLMHYFESGEKAFILNDNQMQKALSLTNLKHVCKNDFMIQAYLFTELDDNFDKINETNRLTLFNNINYQHMNKNNVLLKNIFYHFDKSWNDGKNIINKAFKITDFKNIGTIDIGKYTVNDHHAIQALYNYDNLNNYLSLNQWEKLLDIDLNDLLKYEEVQNNIFKTQNFTLSINLKKVQSEILNSKIIDSINFESKINDKKIKI